MGECEWIQLSFKCIDKIVIDFVRGLRLGTLHESSWKEDDASVKLIPER